MKKHFNNLFLYIFCIPYVALRTIVSLVIKVDAWNDKVIDQFKIDTKNDIEEDDFARANRESKLKNQIK